ncbi:hypothetical protein BKA67DRAFT_581084 [Truncatella angustata]|uniref:O-fucosyltransferase family protein n=1 Tax=Truncatella angustata TaxID=152316 RepID=A0A9P8RPL6_9PEZI|nr:uncharacterized protein BKA67DRAFT_581084 [Truncatella angustata]KAH6646961.1 hypothetical protein BKA67DRAFT_581084 [Truncatella angustata]
MVSATSPSRRFVQWAAIVLSLLFVWNLKPLPWEKTPTPSKASIPLPHVANYFDQAYSVSSPSTRGYAYVGLKQACDHATWAEDAPYLNCFGMLAGITSIMSQVKVCLKMAVDTGSNLVLPRMPLRSSDDLKAFNLLNEDAYMAYDQWFDEDHLRGAIGRACPRMRIVHPTELDTNVEVRRHWAVSVEEGAIGYRKSQSYFWVGRSWKNYFDEHYLLLKFLENSDPKNKDSPKAGITVVNVDSEFLLFRIMDDPSGRELRLWNDLSHVIRFREQPRQIVDRVLSKIPRSFYGVHFRVENDTIWSGLENQLKVDLDALDKAWAKFGKPGQQKPLVYLACGDQVQVEKFVEAGAKRGWEVTHKWKLMQDDENTTEMIDDLPFDFQGVVDMGVMVRSEFFFGITGSAFSTTVANIRDMTGRYRGSSFDVWDDGGARSHLFFEGDNQYACCL